MPKPVVKPTRMWAAVSEDNPPQFLGVAHWRNNLQQNVQHVRVLVTPIKHKRPKRTK